VDGGDQADQDLGDPFHGGTFRLPARSARPDLEETIGHRRPSMDVTVGTMRFGAGSVG
jgi:hypothetical protein